MKTYNAKPGEITREWYVVDADGKTLGVGSMAIGAAILVTAPAPWLLRRRRPPEAEAPVSA